MDVREFSRKEYREVFPQGTAKTPIGAEDSRKADFIMSVVVTIEETKVAISTYKRKRREVLSKIKKAGVIAYEKDYGTSRTNGI